MVSWEATLSKEMSSSTSTLFLQLILILVLCQILGRLVALLKQPPVVGEIIAGIIMGPSVLCSIPAFKAFMFPPGYQVALKGLSDLGVVFFMFILGLEFNPVVIMKSVRKTWMIGAASIALPFGLGAAISTYMYNETGMATTNPQTTLVAFILFTASSMSFTAFPVLARILTANNALTAQIGLVSMGVSSLDDSLAWTVLAIATSYQTGGSPQNGAWGILVAIAWVIFLLTVGRRTMEFLRTRLDETVFIVSVFIGMCVSAWFTQVLGLHAFFGGFIFGVSVPKTDRMWNSQFIQQLEVVIVNFFVPIFFCNSGLNTDFSQLRGSGGPIVLVIVLASVGKMLPPLLLGRFLRKYSWSFSFQLAALMNSRGLVELIALSIALSSGAFNVQMYSVFVIMALTTTFMAGPMFYFSYDPKKDPPAKARISSLAAEKHEQQDAEDPAAPIQPVDCVEIPKDEQMPPTPGGSPFSGYLFTAQASQAKIETAEPLSRASTTTTSSAATSTEGMHKMERMDMPEPELQEIHEESPESSKVV